MAWLTRTHRPSSAVTASATGTASNASVASDSPSSTPDTAAPRSGRPSATGRGGLGVTKVMVERLRWQKAPAPVAVRCHSRTAPPQSEVEA